MPRGRFTPTWGKTPQGVLYFLWGNILKDSYKMRTMHIMINKA